VGTKKDVNSEIDEDAVHVVEGILRGGDWGRSKPQPDKVGLDMRVDLLEGSHPQIGFYLQIKGMGPKTRRGETEPIVSKAGTVDKAIELEHLDYYMKLTTPVFLVVVDVVRKLAYYVHIQRHIREELTGDDWREKLLAYQAPRNLGRSPSRPKKTIRVPTGNVLSDTEAFKVVVKDAEGYMASLSVEPGIAYREEALQRLDQRFKVTYLKSKDGQQFHIEAREPVEFTMRARLPKDKHEALFGKGLPVEIEPGELTFQGMPLWEKINSGAKSFQMKQQHKGIVDIVRLEGSGRTVATLEYLQCDIEGGRDEWRLKVSFPQDLATIGYSLDLRAIRDNPRPGLAMNSTFTYKIDYSTLRGRPIMSVPVLEQTIAFFCGIADTDRFRIDLAVMGIGKTGEFTLHQFANEMFSEIGCLYEILHKARAVARFFNIDPRIPAKLQAEDANDIAFLYKLIQGGAVLEPQRFSEIRATVVRDDIAALMTSFATGQLAGLSLQSEANYSFLGATVHVDNVVLEISNAKLITRKSDITRRLQAGFSEIFLRFTPTDESRQTVKLGCS